MTHSKCFLCGASAVVRDGDGDFHEYQCRASGARYRVTGSVLSLPTAQKRIRARAAPLEARVRRLNKECQGANAVVPFVPDDERRIDEFLQNPPKLSRRAQAQLVVDHYLESGEEEGNHIKVERWRLPAMAEIGDDHELNGVLHALKSDGLVQLDEKDPGSIRLTRRAARRSSRSVFVAMWFAPQHAQVFDRGIRPATEECGLEAYRIDHDRSVDDIPAAIFEKIDAARFVIADATNRRPCVFLEAGYAMGRRIEVVWITKKDETENDLPFDTRHVRHVEYRDEEQLRTELVAVIRDRGLAVESS